MKLKYLSVLSFFLFSGCKIIKPGNTSNTWNDYSVECCSVRSTCFHWPWKTQVKHVYNWMPVKPGFVVKGHDTRSGLISLSNGWTKFQPVFVEPVGRFLEKDLLNFYVEDGIFSGKTDERRLSDSGVADGADKNEPDSNL